MKIILAVMNTTWAVVKIRPEKNSALYGIWTYDLRDTSSAPSIELTSQLGAGHYVGSKYTREVMNKRLWIYESHISVELILMRYLQSTLAQLPLALLFRSMQALSYSSSLIVTVSSTSSSASASFSTSWVTKKSYRLSLSVPSLNLSHKLVSPFKLFAWTVKQILPSLKSLSSISVNRDWNQLLKLLKSRPTDWKVDRMLRKVRKSPPTLITVSKRTDESKIKKRIKGNFRNKSPTKFQSENERFFG